MADRERVMFLVVIVCFFCDFHGVFGAHEYFCKDPDTGKLHALNTTWSSTTFCGNYTCKLRNKYVPADMETHASETIQYVLPIPKKNIDEIVDQTNHTKSEKVEDTKNATLRTNVDIVAQSNEKINSEKSVLNKVEDRFLNEAEIKAMSELLHMVKKSDLEAVIEVYKIAQEIYNEMETSMPAHKAELQNLIPKNQNVPKNSYWYDPLSNNVGKAIDMSAGASNQVQTRQPPPYANYYNQAYAARNMPYYYPISSFQKYASYGYNTPPNPTPVVPVSPVTHEAYGTAVPIQTPVTPTPVTPCPWASTSTNRPYSTIPQYGIPRQYAPPGSLLPFPFTYVNRYNLSYPHQYYFYPWVHQEKATTSVLNEPLSYPAKSEDKAILVNQELHEDVVDVENKDEKNLEDVESNLLQRLINDHNEEDNLAPWQTIPLAEHVLDEVKANILENSEKLLRPFNIPRKLKLEKVAKVLKLDDLARIKREKTGDINDSASVIKLTENTGQVYIEKIVCPMDTKPGLFRVGNLTAPFPYCCPQLIEESEIETKDISTDENISTDTTVKN